MNGTTATTTVAPPTTTVSNCSRGGNREQQYGTRTTLRQTRHANPHRFLYLGDLQVPISIPACTHTHEHRCGFYAGVGVGRGRVTHGLPVTCTNNTTVDYNAFWCNGLDADSLTLLHNQQLRLVGWEFNPGWWQVSRFALGVSIYNLTTLMNNSRGIQLGLDMGWEAKSQSLGGCKPYGLPTKLTTVPIMCIYTIW